jgi:hypothetical protein
VVDGTEGPGSFNELKKLVVASLQRLQTVGASKSGSEGERRARGVKVEDRGRRRRDRGGGGGGEKVCGGGGDQRRQGRASIGWRDTRCFGGETEKGIGKSKREGEEETRVEVAKGGKAEAPGKGIVGEPIRGEGRKI